MMITTKKVDSLGQFQKWKGRLVARGDRTSVEGDNYAPTSAFNSFILTINHAAMHNHSIDIIDIKGAYLHSDISEDVQIKFSRTLSDILIGLDPTLKVYLNHGKLICKLKKALYGLRQSAKAWYDKLSQILISAGFQKAEYDAALFTRGTGIDMHLVDTHSDDIISAGPEHSRKALHKHLIDQIGEEDVTYQESVTQTSVLGLWLNRKGKIIELSCPKLIDQITEGITTKADTPYTFDLNEEDSSGQANQNEQKWFRSNLMKINFVLRTRPELKFAVSTLSRQMQNPTENAVRKLKRICQYLLSTKEYTYVISPSSFTLSASVDASFAVHKDGAKSQMGMAINIGEGNAPIQTSSKIMSQVQPDTTAAELGALSIATKEILWWIHMFESLGITAELQDKPVPIQQDNTSTIILSKRGPGFGKSRYLNVAYFYVKQFIDRGDVELIKTDSNEMIADGFTKALPKEQFREFTRKVLNLDSSFSNKFG